MYHQVSPNVDFASQAGSSASTLVELLRRRARRWPRKLGYTFLLDGETKELHLTYGELARRAQAIAARLRLAGAEGGRALLLYPPGLDFIAGFFGCLYAGVVAVPAYPPDPAKLNRTLPRLQSIVADAQATMALTTSPILSMAEMAFAEAPNLKALHWLATDTIGDLIANDWQDYHVTADDLAFLQYTSGSTGNPRGVMLTHANLLHNAGLIFSAFEHSPGDSYVSWLPTFHDMGFMVGILQPLYAGIPAVLMSPASFLQCPLRWLQAISRYQATTSGGPNFAYDLCVRKITAEESAALDLSSWSVAFNGAEPVRSETLERFASRFEPCGFRRRALYPCYGLAEATLVVTGGRKESLPIIKRVETVALEQGRTVEAASDEAKAKTLVGCGSELRDERVRIVDPESLTECREGQIGEIWVAGPSVAQGYWNRPDETERTFRAFLSDSGEGPYLRTEDLGFIEDRELYITGRIKDLVIIRGLNHYPQDIEWTVERCHAALRPGCGAAFSVDVWGEERLVIVQEVDTRRELDTQQIINRIREAVASEHELQAYAVALVKPSQIHKTSSGKIQRRASRKAFLEGTLDLVAEWRAGVTEENDPPLIESTPHGIEELQSWLASELAAKLRLDSRTIDVNQPLARYGLDSLTAIELAHAVETKLGIDLPMVSFLQASSIAQLAAQALTQSPARSQSLPTAAREREVEYPLSYGQRGLWFLHNLAPESTAYNLARAARVLSGLNVSALKRAFQTLVDRHASLRATFAASQGEPFQRVHERLEVSFKQENAQDWGDALLNGRLVEEANRPFDLEHGPLLRISLFTRPKGEHILLLVAHHIVLDFWSLAVLMHELGILYGAENSGECGELPPLASAYSDFVRWQREMLASLEGGRLWDYWRTQLAGELPALNLPTKRPRPLIQTYRGASQPFRLSAELSRRLRATSRDHGVTLYVTLLAAFQVLLSRYASQEEVVVGTTTAGRARAEFGPLAGYFVNPVVLRSEASAHSTFAQFLTQVRQIVLDAFEHQDYPFPLLVERLDPARDPSRSPLFQVMFTWQKAQLLDDGGLSLFALGEAGARMNLGGLELESISLEQRVAQFDLTLMMAEADDDHVVGTFEYNTDLFDAGCISRMTQSFQSLLEGIVANPAERISRLPLLTAAEANLLVEQLRAPLADSPPQVRTLHQWFEQQVERAPEATAVVFDDQRFSYRDLNDRANKLARHLLSLGVGPEALVGIYVERSVEMLVGLLGILKAGGAYLPLDTSSPTERLAFMLDDAQASVLVTQEHLLEQLPKQRARTVCLDRDWEEIEQERANNPAVEVSPDNAAYVIYTSGSTGQPKGVVVTHRNVVRLFTATRAWFDFSERDVWTLFHSSAFDFSVWELWGALCFGGRLVVVPYFVSRSPEAFYELLVREQVTVLNQTPSAFRQLIEVEERANIEKELSLRVIIFGGEALEVESLRGWIARHGVERPELINMYGITETTVHVTYRRIRMADAEAGRGSVIGRPIPDLQVYVLDQHQQPVPMGVAGELCIAGEGLARGYLNHPALTAERFIADPFGQSAGARLYRSGDLGRYLADGEIEYLGRIDSQVKIRGFRIEPGEIELLLNAHPSVRESIVIAREDAAGDKRLVAYVVARGDDELRAEELRGYLKKRLPDYMLPSAIVELESLLLTPNGKVDRRALPVPDKIALRSESTFEAPRTKIEETLAAIWSEVLRVERVGVYDNFFELGGDSILSLQVIARAREAGMKLTPKQLFQHQTIAELAQVVGALRPAEEIGSSEFELVRLNEPQLEHLTRAGGQIEDVYPLSPMQQGMLFHSLYEPHTGVYVTQLVCELKGELDCERFASAWLAILNRYSALRTDFEWEVTAEPIQVVRRAVEVRWTLDDWRGASRKEQDAKLEEYLRQDREQGFDLRRAPLMRLALVRRSDEESAFILSNHHLLMDGWSLSILLEEVFALYDAYLRGEAVSLSETRPFKDYIVWLRQQDRVGAEDFWRETLKGFTTPTPLGIESKTANLGAQDEGYNEETLHLSAESTAQLRSLARQHQLTLNTLVQGAWALLLSRYSRERDIVFGVTSSGRPADLTGSERMVGLFINTLPVRVQAAPKQSLISWLKDFQSRLIEMRQYEYSSLVEVQGWSEVERGTPLFESIFVFENYPVDSSLLKGHERFEIINLRSIEQTNYPLTVAAVPGTELALHIGYETSRFAAGTVQQMLRHLETLLEGMIANPQEALSELSLVTAAERQRLIVQWNETEADFHGNPCLHELFELQAVANSDALALIFEGEQLSYRELNRRANQLAHYLRQVGVGRGMRVGICLERGVELMVGLLGILKAGGAYVPLDPEYPKERLAFMLDDAQVQVVLTKVRLLESLPETRAIALCLDAEGKAIAEQSAERPDSLSVAEDLAYIIYTSGSTGKPKGVMVSHRSVSNHMQWIAREFPLDEKDRMLQKYSTSFDASASEIFYPLIAGAGLVIARPGGQYDIAYLIGLMRDAQVTAIDLVPTLLKALIEDDRIEGCQSLRRIMSGGEALSARLKERVYERLGEVELANMYGPTEATITATCYRCEPAKEEQNVPVGRPVANTRVYVLDEHLEPVPVGSSGEIYIGGRGLAWGYLNQPQLTAEKFIPDPFSTRAGARLFRTGDLGRYSADGDLEYLGRIDSQVKVHGFRIELGEIEARLRQHSAVKEAVVRLSERDGDRRLVAYVVSGEKQRVTPRELRGYLKEALPEHMLPAVIVMLDKLPLLASGKVDERALPVPEEGRLEMEAGYVEPRKPVEKELARIWGEVLRVEWVGVHDNFFELGGDSILSIALIARAREAGLKITPKQLFQYQTIAELAPEVVVSREESAPQQDAVVGPVPLTPIQRWFFEQELPETEHYNQAVMLEVKARVDAGLLERAVEQLIEHHDALRLRFERKAGAWEQWNAARETQQVFRRVDLSHLRREEQALHLERIANEAQASLNLTEGPIIRVLYFDLGAERAHRLLIVIHHLAVDGVSWRILLHDIERAYGQLERSEKVKLPPKTLSFKRWSELLMLYAQDPAVRRELEYWTMNARSKVYKLPVDYMGDNTADSVRNLSVSLTTEETRLLLQEVGQAYRTQINDVLLTALAQALAEWTGEPRLLVDLEGHGREEIFDVDVSRTIGWFTTIFPVRLEVASVGAPGETLKSVKEQLRHIPQRGIVYGVLKYLSAEETVSEQLRNGPQAEMSFNYLGQLDQVLRDEASRFALTDEPIGRTRSMLGQRNYLIEVDGAVRDGRLQMEWAYSEHVHAHRTIECVAESFIKKLRKLIEHCVLREVGEHTPSDFDLVKLDERQLERLQRMNGQIEDIYPLSPMQQGMLFHSLYGPSSEIYLTQLVCELEGRLDEEAFEAAWQAALDAHAMLRTCFEWEAVEEAVQVVRRTVKAKLKREDWRSFSRREQEERLAEYLRQDRQRGFDLREPPLMRFALVRQADEAYLFLWSSHHLLMDGWSLPLILKDVLTAYAHLRRKERVEMKPARRFRDYIAWLKRQDLSRAEDFWRQLLRGFQSPTPLVSRRTSNTIEDSAEQYAEQQIQLAESLTSQLQALAYQHQLTLNSIVQGAWALCLSLHAGKEDVVFGVVVSGRSAEIREVEKMVGLFINTLPVRARIAAEADLIAWLKQLQAQQAEIGQYEYSPLAQVQAWSEVPRGTPLFESIFVFENYPVESAAESWLEESHSGLRVGRVRSLERSNYPLTIWAIPGHELMLKIGYATKSFDGATINELLKDYRTLLEAIASNPQRRISELALPVAARKHATSV